MLCRQHEACKVNERDTREGSAREQVTLANVSGEEQACKLEELFVIYGLIVSVTRCLVQGRCSDNRYL
jgi:hypothetical protein